MVSRQAQCLSISLNSPNNSSRLFEMIASTAATTIRLRSRSSSLIRKRSCSPPRGMRFSLYGVCVLTAMRRQAQSAAFHGVQRAGSAPRSAPSTGIVGTERRSAELIVHYRWQPRRERLRPRAAAKAAHPLRLSSPSRRRDPCRAIAQRRQQPQPCPAYIYYHRNLIERC